MLLNIKINGCAKGGLLVNINNKKKICTMEAHRT